MNEKIKAARKQLGSFFRDRRLQMGRTDKEVADFIGVTAETLRGIETGRFACDMDTMLSLCAALEVKPFFAPQEEIGGGSLPDQDGKAKFLLVPDPANAELYILHRQYPACLIQIIQTAPVTFRIVDLYDDIEESELATHPFLNEAKKFFKEYAKGSIDRN